MINFDYLEQAVDSLTLKFAANEPFEHIVIDDFCDSLSLAQAIHGIPAPEVSGDKRSRDYIFAKNKFEKADFNQISEGMAELKTELMSERFASWVSKLTGHDIFIDPGFHGGGLHQGGRGSFLNMHADFNFHPLHPDWFRNINILIYLNEGWVSEHGGELKLTDGRGNASEVFRISPLFNRAVIMFTREYTLHGYERIHFPDNTYRRSIAAYGYSKVAEAGKVRTTVWYPEDGGIVKRFLGKQMPRLVRIKSALFGSGTTKNK